LECWGSPEKGACPDFRENRGTWVLMASKETLVFKDQMALREHEGTMESLDRMDFRVIRDLQEHRECQENPENWECKENLVVLDRKVPLDPRA